LVRDEDDVTEKGESSSKERIACGDLETEVGWDRWRGKSAGMQG
jgi:hypothetical protein